MENVTWMPQKEYEYYLQWRQELKEKGKEMDWAFKAYIQLLNEQGKLPEMDPIIRHTLLIQAYS